MPRLTIITTVALATGTTLLVYRQGAVYQVGVLSSHLRPIPLEASTYATYGEAEARLEQEARQRRQ